MDSVNIQLPGTATQQFRTRAPASPDPKSIKRKAPLTARLVTESLKDKLEKMKYTQISELKKKTAQRPESLQGKQQSSVSKIVVSMQDGNPVVDPLKSSLLSKVEQAKRQAEACARLSSGKTFRSAGRGNRALGEAVKKSETKTPKRSRQKYMQAKDHSRLSAAPSARVLPSHKSPMMKRPLADTSDRSRNTVTDSLSTFTNKARSKQYGATAANSAQKTDVTRVELPSRKNSVQNLSLLRTEEEVQQKVRERMNITLKSLGPRKSCERQQESDGAASKGFATGLSDHVRSQLMDNFEGRVSNKLASIDVDPLKIQDSIDLTTSAIFEDQGIKKVPVGGPRKSPNIKIRSNRSSQRDLNDFHLISVQSCSSKAALDSNYMSDRRSQVLKQYVSNSHSKGLEKSLNSNMLKHTTIDALQQRDSTKRSKIKVNKTMRTPVEDSPSEGSGIRRMTSDLLSATAVSPSRAAVSPRRITFPRQASSRSRSIHSPNTLFSKKRQPLSKKSYGAFEPIDSAKKQKKAGGIKRERLTKYLTKGIGSQLPSTTKKTEGYAARSKALSALQSPQAVLTRKPAVPKTSFLKKSARKRSGSSVRKSSFSPTLPSARSGKSAKSAKSGKSMISIKSNSVLKQVSSSRQAAQQGKLQPSKSSKKQVPRDAEVLKASPDREMSSDQKRKQYALQAQLIDMQEHAEILKRKIEEASKANQLETFLQRQKEKRESSRHASKERSNSSFRNSTTIIQRMPDSSNPTTFIASQEINEKMAHHQRETSETVITYQSATSMSELLEANTPPNQGGEEEAIPDEYQLGGSMTPIPALQSAYPTTMESNTTQEDHRIEIDNLGTQHQTSTCCTVPLRS